MIDNTSTTVYIVLDIILGLVVICSNLLVCYVIIYSNNLRKKAMYIFVTSLAMADICVGLTAVPFGILTKLGLPYDSPSLCITMLSFIVISTQISIFNMMAIAIERYLAICHPRIHYTRLTPTRSVYVIIITWCVASLVGSLPLLGWNKIESPAPTQIPTEQINATIDEKRRRTESYPSSAHNTNFHNIFFEDDSSNYTNHKHCRFMQIMDENYMFFNFSVCVLPPLLTCAVLYFIIFMSLVHNKLPSDHLNELSKYSSPKIGDKAPATLQRKPSTCEKKKLRAIYSNNSNGTTNQVKMLLDFQMKKTSLDRETTNNKKNQNAIKEIGNSSAENSSDEMWIPLHRASNSKKSKEKNTTLISSQIESLKDNERRHPLRDVFKHKFNRHLYEDSVNSNRSSCASTPILIRSMSGSRLNLKDYRKKKRENSNLKSKKEIHAATVLGLIVLCFVVCWMPIHVLNTIHKFNVNHAIIIPTWLFDVGVLLSHTNSAVNFFLYSWRLKAFRKQLHRVTIHRISRT